MTLSRFFGATVLSVTLTTVHAQSFLDLASVTPGSSGVGTFSGTLGGISVSGSIFGPPVFSFNPVGGLLGSSTIDGSSPQFSYSSVFSPSMPGGDRVGFTYTAMASSTVSVVFGSPVTNPVFHFANLDWMAVSFVPTPGFTSLTLLNGNGGPDLDGIDPGFGGAPYGFGLVWDKNPATSDATPPTSAPPTAGGRSAYGSVQVNGTFSTVNFATDAMGPFADSGSFTISTVPEPTTVSVVAAMALAVLARRRK